MSKFFTEEGEEVEGFTKEEVEAQIKEKDDAVALAQKEVLETKEHLAKKTHEFMQAKNGFTAYSKMSDEEKAKLSAEQTETLKQLEDVRTTQANERLIAKEAMFKAVARGDENVLAKIKEKYELVTMPESTTEEIQARINAVAGWAYNELGIIERHPIIETAIGSGGMAPRIKDEEGVRPAETEHGKAVEGAMFGHVLPTKK